MKIFVYYGGGRRYTFVDENDIDLFYGQYCGLLGTTRKLINAKTNELISILKTPIEWLFYIYPVKNGCNIVYKNTMFSVNYKSAIKGHCATYKNYTFYIYKHKHLRTSVFIDDNQVGYFELETVSFSNTSCITIELLDNCDVELICSIIFSIIGTFDSDDGLTINIGMIGKEYKPFNFNWKEPIH